ncbi:hypothetical protein KVV02_005102 [Mortierella alpina]|uniref:Uncharacterized protein n=1 Tax=Mortierella alpina TaxID=64518 RepID=A0A9P8A934_MORAP|nr:hypothetical protein KVV02_005102 [Mortierella alpina]
MEKILKLRFFRFELMKQLIAVKLEPHEDSITYENRLQQLVKLSRADREGTERFTVSVVAESPPDGRYERVKAHFGSEDSIRTVRDIIQLVRKPLEHFQDGRRIEQSGFGGIFDRLNQKSNHKTRGR